MCRHVFSSDIGVITTLLVQVLELAALIESRQVTSVELVEIFTARLKKCVTILHIIWLGGTIVFEYAITSHVLISHAADFLEEGYMHN